MVKVGHNLSVEHWYHAFNSRPGTNVSTPNSLLDKPNTMVYVRSHSLYRKYRLVELISSYCVNDFDYDSLCSSYQRNIIAGWHLINNNRKVEIQSSSVEEKNQMQQRRMVLEHAIAIILEPTFATLFVLRVSKMNLCLTIRAQDDLIQKYWLKLEILKSNHLCDRIWMSVWYQL